MQVGELFVNLGIKGSEKAVDAISATARSMGELRSVSLETKATIVGAMYALERLMSHSAASGASLKNFESLTQLGPKGNQDLQRWQEALVNVGGSADDVTNSILAIQSAMAKVDLAKGLPEGMAMISRLAGGIDMSKKDDPFYITAAIRKAFANAKAGPQMAAIMNYLTGTLGISQGMVTGFHKDAFNDQALAGTHPRSQSMIDRLNSTFVAMQKLEFKIGRAADDFTAKHGEKLIHDIDKLTMALFSLANALSDLAQNLHVFDAVDSVVDKAASITGSAANMFKAPSIGSAWSLEKQVLSLSPLGLANSLSKSISTSVYQTINHYGDAKDTKAVGDIHKQAVKNAVKQSPALLQGN